METYTKEQHDAILNSAVAEASKNFETEHKAEIEKYESDIKELKAENEKQKSEIDKFEAIDAENKKKYRESYIDSQIKEGRLLPKQREAAVKMYEMFEKESGSQEAQKQIEEYFNAIPKGILSETAAGQTSDEDNSGEKFGLSAEDYEKYSDKNLKYKSEVN